MNPATADGGLPETLPPFDLATALRRINCNRGLLRGFLVSFHEEFDGAAAALERMIGAGDLAGARRLAHSLKGLAATLEAATLRDAARAVEDALRTGDGAAAAALLPALEQALAPALAATATLADNAAPPIAAPAPRTVPDDAATVLVVDDDATNVAVLGEILGGEHHIVTASGGAEALALIADAPPDLVLLDVMMAGMDGYEVCRRLKADPATAPIPVIFVTALGDSEAEAHGLELGAMDYVTKPVNPPAVRARVRNHIELKRARDQLARLATVDGLTGLANRRRFDEALAATHQRLARTGGTLSLLMLDVDHFKAFNDSYGHLAGDECLRRVGAAIGGAVTRATDLAARYGGEEFVAILPDTDQAGAVALAERVRLAISGQNIPHARSSAADHVTASLGVVTVSCRPDEAATAVVALADEQLYAAKSTGRNKVLAVDRR